MTTKQQALTVSVPAAARMLGVSVNSARRMVAAGELPVIRLRSSGYARVRVADIHRLVNGGAS